MSVLDNIKILNSLSKEDKENLKLFSQERYLEQGEVLFKE
jgi:hypothetical protein